MRINKYLNKKDKQGTGFIQHYFFGVLHQKSSNVADLPSTTFTRFTSKSSAGFSLLETLVAILVVTIALSSFISLVTISLKSLNTAEKRYMAAKIAQEGMELGISKRNNHLFCMQGGSCHLSDWQDRLIGSWEVDATQTNQLLATGHFIPFDSSDYICLVENPHLHAGKFGYCAGESSDIHGSYSREVLITRLGAENILLQSIVKWKDKNTTKELILEEVLFGSKLATIK